jgi:hypothetical protein
MARRAWNCKGSKERALVQANPQLQLCEHCSRELIPGVSDLWVWGSAPMDSTGTIPLEVEGRTGRCDSISLLRGLGPRIRGEDVGKLPCAAPDQPKGIAERVEVAAELAPM